MKKILLLSAAMLLTTTMGFAQVSEAVTLTSAGTLKDYAFTNPANTITDLTLTGNIDARDVRFMRDSMDVLANLNLSGASIAAYTGVFGTDYGYDNIYLANEMPKYSFYNSIYEALPKTSLTSIILPVGLTSIGYRAFFQCSGLTGTLALPENLTFIGYNAFDGCSGLTSVMLPVSLTSIRDGAFHQCSGLTSVTLPAGLTSIGGGAFAYCSGLVEITNLNTIPVAVDTSVFSGLNKDTCVLKVSSASVNLYRDAAVWQDFMHITGSGVSVSAQANNALLGRISGLESKFYSLGDTVILVAIPVSGIDFVNWTSKDVEISVSDTLILTVTMDTAVVAYFWKEVSLNLTEAGTLKDFLTGKPVLHLTVTGNIDARDVRFMRDSIKFLAHVDLSGCSIIAYTGTDGTKYGSEVAYPANEMPEYSFHKMMSENPAQLSIVLPDNITSIGQFAFAICTGLTSINFPSGLTSIGHSAFYNCSNLNSVILPVGLTTIEGGAFAYCGRLTSVILPASLTSIETYAFRSCTGLREIINQKTVPLAINADVFMGVDKTVCTLKVAFGSKALYQAASVWQEFFIEEANVGIEDANDAINAIVIYPNPVQYRLNISGLSGNKDVILTDISGRTLYTGKSDGATKMQIPVSSLASGMYFVRISNKTSVRTVKVVKN
jgi:hypothetical protein